MIILIIALIIAIIAIATAPKPQAPVTSDSDLNVPVSEDGREIMDIGGTCWIDDSNVVDWGGLYTVPVRADGGK
jgi:hypothetical protein